MIIGGLLLLVLIIGSRVIYKLCRETKKNEEEEFYDNRTTCQRYLNKLDDRLRFHLIFNTWNPDWNDISLKLENFPKEEVKKGLEKLLNNIKENLHYPSELQENKNKTVKELEKILNDIG